MYLQGVLVGMGWAMICYCETYEYDTMQNHNILLLHD